MTTENKDMNEMPDGTVDAEAGAKRLNGNTNGVEADTGTQDAEPDGKKVSLGDDRAGDGAKSAPEVEEELTRDTSPPPRKPAARSRSRSRSPDHRRRSQDRSPSARPRSPASRSCDRSRERSPEHSPPHKRRGSDSRSPSPVRRRGKRSSSRSPDRRGRGSRSRSRSRSFSSRSRSASPPRRKRSRSRSRSPRRRQRRRGSRSPSRSLSRDEGRGARRGGSRDRRRSPGRRDRGAKGGKPDVSQYKRPRQWLFNLFEDALKETLETARLPCNVSKINDCMKQLDPTYRLDETPFPTFSVMCHWFDEKEGMLEVSKQRDSVMLMSSHFERDIVKRARSPAGRSGGGRRRERRRGARRRSPPGRRTRGRRGGSRERDARGGRRGSNRSTSPNKASDEKDPDDRWEMQ